MDVHAHRSEQDAEKTNRDEHEKGQQDQQGTNQSSHRCSPIMSVADVTAPSIVVLENLRLPET
jgi:hypothetical protein